MPFSPQINKSGLSCGTLIKVERGADRGCEVALATIEDAASLTTAFRGAEGVFMLVPSSFDPTPGFPEARTIGVTLRAALEAASPHESFTSLRLGRKPPGRTF